MLPFTQSRPIVPPDVSPLQRAGWHIQSITGRYAVAFQGPIEVVFVWRGDGWHQLATRAIGHAARAA